MWYNVFIMTIVHTKALRNDAKLPETEELVEMKRMHIGCYNRIELQDTEAKASSHRERVPDKLFADTLSSLSLPYRITRIADMSATSHIIGMQDIESHDVTSLLVNGNARV